MLAVARARSAERKRENAARLWVPLSEASMFTCRMLALEMESCSASLLTAQRPFGPAQTSRGSSRDRLVLRRPVGRSSRDRLVLRRPVGRSSRDRLVLRRPVGRSSRDRLVLRRPVGRSSRDRLLLVPRRPVGRSSRDRQDGDTPSILACLTSAKAHSHVWGHTGRREPEAILFSFEALRFFSYTRLCNSCSFGLS